MKPEEPSTESNPPDERDSNENEISIEQKLPDSPLPVETGSTPEADLAEENSQVKVSPAESERIQRLDKLSKDLDDQIERCIAGIRERQDAAWAEEVRKTRDEGKPEYAETLELSHRLVRDYQRRASLDEGRGFTVDAVH